MISWLTSTALVPTVIVAGALGALARYGVGLVFGTRGGLPWSVLVVNTVGSAIAGWMIALTVTGAVGPGVALVILTGLCGGLTTFSTWSVETIQLALEGKLAVAALNIALNLAAGLCAAVGMFALTLLLVP